MRDTHQPVAVLPTLDELARDPGKAASLSLDAARLLLAQAHVIEGALLARVVAARSAKADGEPEVQVERRIALSVDEVAEQIGQPVSYVRALCRRAEIVASKPGKDWLIRPDAVEEWLERHQRGLTRSASPASPRSRPAETARLQAVPTNSRAKRDAPKEGA